MDIYSTYFMLAAVREIPLEQSFFKSRYFPTDDAMDVFGTSRVLADYKEKQKRAPFVLPRIGSIPGTRDGFSTAELEPANIAVAMPLTLDQLQSRGFGESLLSTATPAERERHFLVHDLAELSARISRSEELLAVQTILNLCVVTNLLPSTGIALPCFSYGGTALAVNLGEMGIVLGISRGRNRRKIQEA